MVSAAPSARIPAAVIGAVDPPAGIVSTVCGTPSFTYSMKISTMLRSKHRGLRTSA
jgi:hypothetical protein